MFLYAKQNRRDGAGKLGFVSARVPTYNMQNCRCITVDVREGIWPKLLQVGLSEPSNGVKLCVRDFIRCCFILIIYLYCSR